MLSISAMLCRLWKCASHHEPTQGHKPEDATSQSSEVNLPDDLTQIRGIGMTSQNRLYRAGVKTFAQLAQISPDEVRAILGAAGRGSKVETWIKEAAKFAEAR